MFILKQDYSGYTYMLAWIKVRLVRFLCSLNDVNSNMIRKWRMIKWSFSIFDYNGSSNMKYFSILHTISLLTGRCEPNKQNKIDLASNVWLHSSVGRALHRYRGGHGFDSRWSPDFFRLLLSGCLNWKIYCDDHISLSSTTAVQIWIISYKLHKTY